MVAEQFRRPEGDLGRVVAIGMAQHNAPDTLLCLGLLAPQGGERMLEVGMAAGAHVPALLARGVDYTGLDHSDLVVEMASEIAPAAKFIKADICETPAPGEYDCAMSVNCLMWWADPVAALRNMRAARRVVLGVVAPGDYGDHGQKYYTADELGGLFRDSGWKDARVNEGFHNGRTYLIGMAT